MDISFGNFLLVVSIIFLIAPKSTLSFTFISLSVCYLVYSYISANFSLDVVYLSSHADMDLIYKMLAIWTTNQGSMLLWVWVLSLYLFCFNLCAKDGKVKRVAIKIQSYTTAIFLLFVVFAANPFKSVKLTPENGLGLNPVLQDIALGVHPPSLYFGYVGFSLCFSYAIAMLLASDFSKKHFEILKKIHLISFALLTTGIFLGSWWAYRELGWGGFWSWDPVENISLMPWLLSLGAIHSIFASVKQGRTKFFSLFLSISTFVAGVFGTFITRSGIVDSVHAFANNQEQNIYLFLIFCLFATFGFAIFCYRFFCSEFDSNLSGKNYSIILLNPVLCLALFSVLLAITLLLFFSSYLQLANVYITTDFYNKVFSFCSVLLLAGILIYPAFSVPNFIFKYRFSLLLSPLILLYSAYWSSDLLLFALCFLGLFLCSGLTERYIKSLQSFTFWAVVCNRGNAFFLSHVAFGVFLFGVSMLFSLSSEVKMYFKPGDQTTINNIKVEMRGYKIIDNPSFSGIKAIFKIAETKKLEPEFRMYKKERLPNAESAILHKIFDDIYIVITGIDKDLGIAVELYYRKGIQIIWLSFFILILSCFVKIFKPKTAQVMSYEH